MSEVIQHRKLFHEVMERFQETILAGGLRVGEPLPSERDLMERYGVGRPAIREAVLNLERTGLITISGGERARVTRLSAQGMLLEVALVRQAAENAHETDTSRLRAALEENEAARADLPRFGRSDVVFHYVFAKIFSNLIFSAIHHAMVGWLTGRRRITLRTDGASAGATHSHRAIFEAVAAHAHAAAAEAEIRAHLNDMTQLYWRAREQEQSA